MTPELARIKLAAFLQQPPHSALLPEPDRERVAAALLEALTGDSTIPDVARRAAALASAADPMHFPADTAPVDVAAGLALTHPLSRHEPYRTGPLAADPDGVSRDILAAVRTLATRCGTDPLIRCLAAWRWLPDLIREHEPANRRLGALWDVLPADTHLPDRTVWDQVSVTAALAGADNHPALLIFALGPVQSFISQARSTRDLWIGSYLVSYLSWAAIRAIADQIGPDALLYPSLRNQPLVDAWLAARGVPTPAAVPPAPATSRQVAAFPNKLLALVAEDSVPALGVLASAAVRDAWAALGQQVGDWLVGRAGQAWQPTAWDAQTAMHVETAWAGLPWPEAGGEAAWLAVARGLLGADGLTDFERTLAALRGCGGYRIGPSSYYGPAHGLAQRAFDARKLTRQFTSVEEPGFKCTLCGQRAPALGAPAGYREQRAIWQWLAEQIRRPDLLEPTGDERLCAVCLTRRIAPETGAIRTALGAASQGFPSTSTLATLPFRRDLRDLIHRATDPSQTTALADFLDALDVLERHQAALGAMVHIDPRTLPGELARFEEGASRDTRLSQRLSGTDGEWLLLETYERRRAELQRRKGDPRVLSALATAGTALRHLLNETRRASLRAPTAYYAILILDGDRMGRWVSGEQHRVTLGDVLHPDIRGHLRRDPTWQEALGERRLFGPATHASLGAILRDFALWVVPDVVERVHGGRVVYAGGDDVLALLPADRALAVDDALRARYTSAFLARDGQGVLCDLPREADPDLTIFRGMGPDATLSAGLLFAHHLLPLGVALEEARRLEGLAKEQGGRDAIAIGIARRSGPDEELVVISKHRRGGETVLGLVAAARALLGERPTVKDAERGAAPSRLPYLLREAAPVLDGLLDPSARQRAVMAVAARHIPAQDGRQRLLNLYDALAAVPAGASPSDPTAATPSDRGRPTPTGPVDELARLLRLARFLAAET